MWKPLTGKEAVEAAKAAQHWMHILSLMERAQNPVHEVADYLTACVLTTVQESELVWEAPIELGEADMLPFDDKECECRGCAVPVTADMIIE